MQFSDTISWPHGRTPKEKSTIVDIILILILRRSKWWFRLGVTHKFDELSPFAIEFSTLNFFYMSISGGASCKGTKKAYLLFKYYFMKTIVINTHLVYVVGIIGMYLSQDTRQKNNLA